jgi:type II secretory pathway pseudopilin PulG
MVLKNTGTDRAARRSGFTLVELMVAAALGLLACLALMLLSVYSSRSFVAIANYVNMDERSQLALDKMSKEIRQVQRLTFFSPTSVTFQDADGQPLQFAYDPGARTLVRISGEVTNTYLTDCDSLEFSKYQGTAISNTFDAYNPAYVTNSRLIQVTWTCSRKILGAKLNTESVQSAKIVIRNK